MFRALHHYIYERNFIVGEIGLFKETSASYQFFQQVTFSCRFKKKENHTKRFLYVKELNELQYFIILVSEPYFHFLFDPQRIIRMMFGSPISWNLNYVIKKYALVIHICMTNKRLFISGIGKT